MSQWSRVYKRAINDDGSLLFPERLTHEFLTNARRTMGSYLFANQYQNEVIPEDEKSFKKAWLRYITLIPDGCYSFGFIDPAIGQKSHNDYTGISIVDVDVNKNWYLKYTARLRLTPTQICDKMFDICKQFDLKALGVEITAYQEALLYILDERMRHRNQILPVKGIQRNSVSKNTRILGLVPRFEWGRLFVRGGMVDFEDEYHSFPRGAHDDILDSVASLEELVYYPERKADDDQQELNPNDPRYESKYLRRLAQRSEDDLSGDY